jgi:hypothetical protein
MAADHAAVGQTDRSSLRRWPWGRTSSSVVASELIADVSWLWLLATAAGADPEEPFGHPEDATDSYGERPAAHQRTPAPTVGAVVAGPALDLAGGNGHRTPTALAVAQDRTPGADQDPAAALDARQRVRALVARERVGGPKVTAAEVIAVTGRSRRRAYELLRDARTEQE